MGLLATGDARWTFGATLAAALAACALVAPAAPAAKFTASAGEGVALSGEQIEGSFEFSLAGQSVTCEVATLSGTAPSEEFTSVTFHPTYEECTAFGFVGATITGFGEGECDYLFHAGGQIDLVCAEGSKVTIDAGTCSVTMEGQEGEGVIYTDDPGHVTDHVFLTNQTYTVHKGFLCPAEGSSTEWKHNGLEVCTTTITAESGTFYWDE